jgi:transposase InsO family protein
VTDRFEFIDAEYAAYRQSDEIYVPSIVKMCRWLEVSRSGFYEWRSAPESATARRRTELGIYVRKSFDESNETYGYRRVHADLQAWGVPAGPELVRSVMRELGLETCQPKPWRFSLTEGDGQEHDIPDLVNRDFTADAPGEKMVGDITYVSTWEGWVYLATVIDCHTKAVIGWAVDDNYKTPLIEQAIAMAARNYRLVGSAIFHSGRGSNYQCRLVKNWVQDGQDRLVAVPSVLRLFHREGAAFVFLDDAWVRPFPAALTDSLEDFPDRHGTCVLEPAGGKMPPGL